MPRVIPLVLSVLLIPVLAPAAYPPPPTVDPALNPGEHIQRTMQRLAASTEAEPETVRILFYGQSITRQDWWKQVAAELRTRFPHADLVIDNLAIDGFSSDRLRWSAEQDLYPYYPDLLIFHVYGSHLDYEHLIQQVRSRTTADVLICKDHVTTDAGDTSWDIFMNYEFLPGIAAEYGLGIVEVRELWREYLEANVLPAAALLKDSIHLNEQGMALMAGIVQQYLVERPGDLPDPDGAVTVLETEVELSPGEVIELPFHGNRIDVWLEAGAEGTMTFELDGQPIREAAGVHSFSRPNDQPGKVWPWDLGAFYYVEPQPHLVPGTEYVVEITEMIPPRKSWKFRLLDGAGHELGTGNNATNFVSTDGLVRIPKDRWFLKDVPWVPITAGYRIPFHVVSNYQERANLPEDGGRWLRVAQGFPVGNHWLTGRWKSATGAGTARLAKVRVHRPPLDRVGVLRTEQRVLVADSQAGATVRTGVVSDGAWFIIAEAGDAVLRKVNDAELEVEWLTANPGPLPRQELRRLTDGATETRIWLRQLPAEPFWSSGEEVAPGWYALSWGPTQIANLPYVFRPGTGWVWVYRQGQGFFSYSPEQGRWTWWPQGIRGYRFEVDGPDAGWRDGAGQPVPMAN